MSTSPSVALLLTSDVMQNLHPRATWGHLLLGSSRYAAPCVLAWLDAVVHSDQSVIVAPLFSSAHLIHSPWMQGKRFGASMPQFPWL